MLTMEDIYRCVKKHKSGSIRTAEIAEIPSSCDSYRVTDTQGYPLKVKSIRYEDVVSFSSKNSNPSKIRYAAEGKTGKFCKMSQYLSKYILMSREDFVGCDGVPNFSLLYSENKTRPSSWADHIVCGNNILETIKAGVNNYSFGMGLGARVVDEGDGYIVCNTMNETVAITTREKIDEVDALATHYLVIEDDFEITHDSISITGNRRETSICPFDILSDEGLKFVIDVISPYKWSSKYQKDIDGLKVIVPDRTKQTKIVSTMIYLSGKRSAVVIANNILRVVLSKEFADIVAPTK